MTVLCAACSMPVLLTLPTHVSLVTSLQMDHLETPVSAMCPGAPHDPMSIPSPCRRHAVRQSSPDCAEILPLGRRPLPPIIGRTPRFADDPKYQPSLTRQRPPDFSIKDLTYNWWVRREGCGVLQVGATVVGMEGTSVACPRDPLITMPVLSCMCRPNPTGMKLAHPGPSRTFWCYFDHASPGPPTLM